MTIKNLIANLITKYRNHCAEVAQLRVEREEARQKLAEAKLELSCMKSDPVFADVHLREGLKLLDDAIADYEDAVVLEKSRSYLGAASWTGKVIMAIPVVLALTLLIAFVGDKAAGLLGFPSFGTQYNITVGVAFFVIALPASYAFCRGLFFEILMRIKVLRLKGLRKSLADAEFLSEFT
jgi:hypothetical protein